MAVRMFMICVRTTLRAVSRSVGVVGVGIGVSYSELAIDDLWSYLDQTCYVCVGKFLRIRTRRSITLGSYVTR
jgi:hypothetical protein